MKNYAFIDGQNFHLGAKAAGVDIDYERFRIYLKEKHHVTTAYFFIGYLEKNQDLYDNLRKWGYELKFKPVLVAPDGQTQKGDIDAHLAFNTMRYYPAYDKAIMVTSDGDFDTLVDFLRERGKFDKVISAHKNSCSSLLKKAARNKVLYLDNIGDKITRGKK